MASIQRGKGTSLPLSVARRVSPAPNRSKGDGGGYGPLSAAELKATLYEFRTKQKTSSIMQIADLYLWPMAVVLMAGRRYWL